jgi:hypothetical protein
MGKKKVKKLRHSGFFNFFMVIQPIRQINNIFIPLSFHWRIRGEITDWNTGDTRKFPFLFTRLLPGVTASLIICGPFSGNGGEILVFPFNASRPHFQLKRGEVPMYLNCPVIHHITIFFICNQILSSSFLMIWS